MTKLSLASLAILLAGCADSHVERDGGGDASCDPFAITCVDSCLADRLLSGVCEDGVAVCPPGTMPTDECPPGTCFMAGVSGCTCSFGIWTCADECDAPRPSEACECIDSEWVCDGECPSGIDPYDPSAPGSACSTEGRMCSSSEECGSAISCTCESGGWNCAFAHPDPACVCEREPTVGGPCRLEEGESCGECCPTSRGTGWAPMTCEDGHWAPADCIDLVCPMPLGECPTDTSTWVGESCGIAGQTCGNACCGDGIECRDGRWERGPDADCLCDPSFTCGTGGCHGGQYCDVYPGPDDGGVYGCIPLSEGCTDCSCISLRPEQMCMMVDGNPYVRAPGPGG